MRECPRAKLVSKAGFTAVRTLVMGTGLLRAGARYAGVIANHLQRGLVKRA